MKFIYCTDLHGKGKNPNQRLDNYFQSWLLKIDEILQLAKKNNCECIICGGDLFHSPNVSNTIIDDFVDKIEELKIKWYVVPGNHDENAHNWELSKTTALAHIFRRSKYIIKLNELLIDNVFIKGQEYYHGIEDDIIENGIKTNSKAEYKIYVPHAFISVKPFFETVSHVCCKDIDTNYDLILCSHFHMSFDETINNTRFLNTNSIGRCKIIEQHIPTVALINTDDLNIELIELKSAKSASEVFDLSKYDETKEKKKDIKEFLDSLKNVDFQAMDIGQQIAKIGKDNKVEKDIIDYLQTKLEKIRNE